MADYLDLDALGAVLKRHLQRYSGFKLICLLLSTLFTISLLWTARRVEILPALPALLNRIWLEYIFVYWTSHPWLFLILIGTCWTLFVLNVLEGPFNRRIPPIPPLSGMDRGERRVRRINRMLTIWIAFALLLVVPLLHLWFPIHGGTLGFILSFLGTLLSFVASVAPPRRVEEHKRLGTYTFRGRPSFNTASMGTEAIEVKAELAKYEEIRGESPISNEVRDYLCNGSDNTNWNGYHDFYAKLATFLDVPVASITTHQNTTNAVNHILGLILENDSRVLTTDLEYPSILEVVKRRANKDRLSMIEIKHEHLSGSLDSRSLVDRLAVEVNRLLRDTKDTNARCVLVLSHVYYLTGAVLDIARLSRGIIGNRERLALVIDGAQAIGNICISRDVLEQCDFYAFSGHKWLLGKTSLGIMIHFPRALSRFGLDLNKVREGTFPFSFVDFDVANNYSSESINIEPMVSLDTMLIEFIEIGQNDVAEHNKYLSQLFARYAPRIGGVTVVSSPVESGIASIRVNDAALVAKALERRHRIVCQAVADDILRFSFHYFVGQRDVYELVESLNRVLKSI